MIDLLLAHAMEDLCGRSMQSHRAGAAAVGVRRPKDRRVPVQTSTCARGGAEGRRELVRTLTLLKTGGTVAPLRPVVLPPLHSRIDSL